MVIVATRFDVAPGKMNEAMEWADKVWKVLENVGGLGSKAWIIRGLMGPSNRITFAGQYASTGEFEEGLDNAFADPALQPLLTEMSNWCTGVERTIGKVIKEA